MFGNFIYFILVLLIYLTYQPSEETNFTAFESFALFLGLVFAFTFFTRFQFQKIERRLAQGQYLRIDHQFNTTLLHQSVLAILLFAVNIYGLNLSSFLTSIAPFRTIPTLLALLFLLLFIFYLAIVWTYAYTTYQRLYKTDISRKTYVFSNISFSVPVLLPWLFLSGIADIINALPFEAPKRFLSTTEGEITYFLFFLVAVAIIGPLLIQKFWRCKPLENGDNRSRIVELCERAGLEYADILYWPIFGGKMITAGVMGLIKNFRYILVTPSLLQLLEPAEVDAVIAHEIGHIKKKHLIFYLAFFVGYMLMSYVTVDMIIFTIIYAKPVYWLINKGGFSQTTVVSGISSVVIICLFLIYFRFIFGFFMRNFERQADTYVYALFDNAQPLISTLEKIAATSGQSADKPNWHHFSIRQRIDYLRKCETNSSWITRQDNKVKKSIGIYLICLCMLGVLGYQLNIGTVGERINSHFFEKIILSEIEDDPDNPDLYSMLGNIYYNAKNWSGTQDAWENSLALKPDNALVLNNLAWHYATCEDQSYQDHYRALALAKLAIRLEKSPHIWDTLAESYYVNSMYRDAVEAGNQALKRAAKNRSYYEDQIKKFERALGS
ncbi:Peptidase, M48 family [Olavius sp. associated proteobacterium Delta 1]|nr:Peptidase, M48 family [Olavius sp. associated proteobacterium Delta 1]